MKTQNPAPEETPFNRFEQILLEQNTCCLCGTELTFVHQTNFQTREVQEQAHCPCCNIRTREQVFSLQ